MKIISLGEKYFEISDYDDNILEKHNATITITKETDKALQLHVVDNYDFRLEPTDDFQKAGGYDFSCWLPKSQINLHATHIELPMWLARKHGLHNFS
jgi:hypothetical protein